MHSPLVHRLNVPCARQTTFDLLPPGVARQILAVRETCLLALGILVPRRAALPTERTATICSRCHSWFLALPPHAATHQVPPHSTRRPTSRLRYADTAFLIARNSRLHSVQVQQSLLVRLPSRTSGVPLPHRLSRAHHVPVWSKTPCR